MPGKEIPAAKRKSFHFFRIWHIPHRTAHVAAENILQKGWNAMAEITVNNQNQDESMKNEVNLVGHMVSRSETQGCLTAYFRTTTQHGKRPYTNTMTLLSFDPEVSTKVNTFKLRQKVKVKGYVSTSRRRNEETPTRQGRAPQGNGTADADANSAQEGQAQPAAQQPRDIEDFDQIFVVTGIEEAGNEADENSITVEGTVVRTRVTRKGSVIFVIRTRRGDGTNMPCLVKATASPQVSPDLLSMMPAGSKVAFTGHCSAHSVNRDGRIEYFESIVIDGISHA